MSFSPSEKVQTLKSWEDFCEILKGIYEFWDNKKDSCEAENSGKISSLLFRGQSNAAWKLESTLLRYTDTSKYSAHAYLEKIFRTKQEIETFLNLSWEIEYRNVSAKLKKMARERDSFFTQEHQKLYEFYTYLRHYGFPSPLLDWSKSPYIAAYFAFKEKFVSPPEFVSIFTFLEFPHGEKQLFDPYLGTLSQHQKTHSRHFLQQCEYTICIKHKKEEYFFLSHDIFFNQPSIPGQDLLWKFDIPYSERKKVLQFLDKVNLNGFSLFQSGEGLMETMANREFFLK